MLTRILGLIIFIAAMGIAYLAYEQYSDEIDWSTGTPAKRISLLIQSDFEQLEKENALPPEWKHILKTTYKMNSPVTASLMGDERPHLKTTHRDIKDKPATDLTYEAEIEVIDLPDDKNPGFILQISLLDIKTRNKVFEIGRSYYFKKLNKKKPD